MESYLCMNSRLMEFRMFLSSPGSVCGAAPNSGGGSEECLQKDAHSCQEGTRDKLLADAVD